MPMQMAAAGDEREAKRACMVDAATTGVRQCWSSTFPDDLLAVVYRMVASPRGRVRFAAVCRSWRAAARASSPAVALPWLLLSPWDSDTVKRLYCPEDGTVVRVPLQGRRELVGCHDGGWVATFLPASLKIVNLLSGAEVKLGEKQFSLVCANRRHALAVILKIVFSEPPTFGNCILAAMTNRYSVGLCRVGCQDSGWTIHEYNDAALVDITFCNGELYGLREHRNELVKFQIGVNEEDGVPVVIAEHQLAMGSIGGHISEISFLSKVSYIFDLHGKLAMAKRAHWSLNQEPFFKVFELLDNHASGLENSCYKHNWVEVANLGDNALFVGRAFSKAVCVPANTPGGVERNHIYFAHHSCYSRYNAVPKHTVLLPISDDNKDQAYFIEEQDRENDIMGDEAKRITSVGYFTKGVNDLGGAWVLP